MMMTFITQGGEGQRKTNKKRKATKSKGSRAFYKKENLKRANKHRLFRTYDIGGMMMMMMMTWNSIHR